MTSIAIDIGTTKICVLAINAETGEVLEKLYADTPALKCTDLSENESRHAQDPGLIIRITEEMYASLAGKYRPVACIGVTGQMHGMLYVNTDGMAISPLYTWQDERGGLVYRDNKTYTEILSCLTDAPVASGYGLVTHYYMQCNNLVPKDAAKICTIGGYVTMRLARLTQPLEHITNAASLGFHRTGEGFDHDALLKAGIDTSLLPSYTESTVIAGITADGVPVSCDIGDNQASFLGAVADWENSLFANIGTGSQISFTDNKIHSGMEARPFFDSRLLNVGAGLCGGRAYALLEKFFRQVLDMAGYRSEALLYQAMDRCLSNTDIAAMDPLRVTTKFSGTRKNPDERGKIENLSFENFTPRNMMLGFLSGIA